MSEERHYSLLSWLCVCALASLGALGASKDGYLPKVGPSPLRFESFEDEDVPQFRLPPLVMGNEPEVPLVATNSVASNSTNAPSKSTVQVTNVYGFGAIPDITNTALDLLNTQNPAPGGPRWVPPTAGFGGISANAPALPEPPKVLIGGGDSTNGFLSPQAFVQFFNTRTNAPAATTTAIVPVGFNPGLPPPRASSTATYTSQ